MDVSRHLRLYRLLLRLFPRSFREKRAGDMELLFVDMCRERRAEGRPLGPGFWLPLVWDTLSHAMRERLSPRAARHDRSSPRASLGTALWTDLRHAARSVARQPLYGAMIVLMMTLGIGGTTAVFRVFNGLFLRPLPFPAAERLVDLDVRAPQWDLEYVGIAYADFAAWRERNRSFEAMGVYDVGGASYAGDDGARRVSVVAASHDLAGVLGMEPAVGRFFTPEEDVPDGSRVVLLTHRFWQEVFGGARDVVGRSAILDGEPYEIVGVLPPEAAFVAEADVWAPLQEDPTAHSSFYLTGIGRLRPGVGAERALEDLTRIHKGLVEEYSVNEVTFPVVSSLRDRYLGDYRLGSGVLLGAVAIVLLIACADIAGLVLARSMERTREIGVRLAMGAPRTRIVRQLLTESVLLAALGAVVGAWIGFEGSELLVSRMAEEFPPWVTFGLDWRFVLFTVAVTGGAVVLFGLAPAVRTSGVDPAGALGTSSTRTTVSGRGRRTMAALVVGEVALAMVLLVVAGLSVRDFQRLQRVDPGLRTGNVLSYRVALPDSRYEDADARLAFWDSHLERLQALPGVVGAAGTTVLPLSGQHSGWFFVVEDAPPRGENERNPVVLNRAVSPGYLETMGVELVRGRDFTDFDGRDEGTYAAVVNETFVREFLSHRSDPVGARLQTGTTVDDEDPWWTVVGVTRDTKHYGLDEEMRPAVYQPLRQMPIGFMNVVIRTSGDPTALAGAARTALREQDPQVALFDVTTMEERLHESLWSRRAASWLIATFSIVALVLAVAGLYGIVSYSVRQRVREIGIRMALGAARGRVVGQVLRRGMAIVGLGVVVGLAGALAAAGLVSDILVTGVSPTDPLIYLGVSALLLAVAAVANWIPARRAARLEVMGVLRGE